MKVALNSRGLQDFFMQHVEKMVFGLMILAIGWGLYEFVTHETFQRSPEQLKAEVDKARAHVLGSTWDPVREQIDTKDPTQSIGDKKQMVAAGTFIWDRELLPASDAIKAARKQPTLLAAQEPEVHVGFGPIAFQAEGARGRPQQQGPAGGGLAAGGAAGAAGVGGAAGAAGVGGAAGAPGVGGAGGAPGVGGAAGAPGVGGAGGAPGVGGAAGAAGARPGAAAAGGAAAGGAVNRNQQRRGSVSLPSGSVVQGKDFVVVTAVAPYLKQANEYYQSFRDCRFTDPVKDRPAYLGMRIFRAEVKSDDPNEELKYVDLREHKARLEIENWAGFAAEVVNPAAVDVFLTWRLPLLVDGEWGRNVAHARLPALNAEMPLVEEELAEEEATEEEGEEDDDDAFARRAASGGRRDRGPGIAGGGAMTGGGAMAGGANRARATGGTSTDRLVRFIDFSVKPGKRYRYKVQLVLENPNYGVPTRHLETASLGEKNYIEAPESEPTPIVTIPRGSSLLAGGVRPAQGANEPTADVMLVQQSKDYGVNLMKVFRMMRGQMADYPKESLIFTRPDNPDNPEELKDVSLSSKSVLLDLRGGELLPDPTRRLRDHEPAELLILDPDGRLVVRSELADGPDYAEKKGRLDEWGKILKPGKEEEKSEGDSFIDSFAKQPAGGAAAAPPGAPGGNRKKN
jgi:hypothetical protein